MAMPSVLTPSPSASSGPAWKGFVLPALALLAAEALLRALDLRSDGVALPSEVWAAGWSSLAQGQMIGASAQTLVCAVGGLLAGSLAGLVLGIALGLWRPLERLSGVSVELLRTLPPVALIPIAILSFGFGYRMEIALVAFTCFWPMLLLTQVAVKGVDVRLLEVARVLGFTPLATAVKIVIPAAAARIFIAFRLAASIALVVAITTEIAENPMGLGHRMMMAQQELRVAEMYAVLVWLALLGWGVNAGLLRLQRRLFPATQGASA
jgi:ABC-type nitrate/sulfonate/bicarbonate transport system permease component